MQQQWTLFISTGDCQQMGTVGVTHGTRAGESGTKKTVFSSSYASSSCLHKYNTVTMSPGAHGDTVVCGRTGSCSGCHVVAFHPLRRSEGPAARGLTYPHSNLDPVASFKQASEALPVEERARVGLATGSNIRMTGDVLDRVMRPDGSGDGDQTLVLRRFEWHAVATLELDADREVVTAFPAGPARYAGMPGTCIGRDKLHYQAVAPNKKVRRKSLTGDSAIVRMR